MTLSVAPPVSVEDFFGKIIEAYAAAGFVLNDDEKTVMADLWSKSWFYQVDDEIKKMTARYGIPQESLGFGQWSLQLKKLLKAKKGPDDFAPWLAYLMMPLMTFDEMYALFRTEEKRIDPLIWRRYSGIFPASEKELDQLITVFYQENDKEMKQVLLLLLGKCFERASASLLVKITEFHCKIYTDEPDLYKDIDRSVRGHTTSDMLDSITDPNLLVEMIKKGDDSLKEKAINQYSRINSVPDWSRLYDIARQHPKIFAEAFIYNADRDLLQILWDTEDITCRQGALRALWWARCQRRQDQVHPDVVAEQLDTMLDLLQSWLETEQDVAAAASGKDKSPLTCLTNDVMMRYWALNSPIVQGWVVRSIFDIIHSQQWNIDNYDKYSLQSLSEYKRRLENIKTLLPKVLPWRGEYSDLSIWFGDNDCGTLEKVISNIGPDLAPHIFQGLKTIILNKQGNSSWMTYEKPVRQGVMEYLSLLPARQLLEGGWLTDQEKEIRAIGYDAIQLSSASDLREVLREACVTRNLKHLERGILLDRLEALGEDVSDLDQEADLDLPAWQSMLGKQRVKIVPKELRSQPFMDLLSPLEEKLTRYFIAVASEVKEGRVPRQARHILHQLGGETRDSLTRQLFDYWVSVNGTPKFAWMLNFVVEYGDDSFVPSCKKAIDTWRKPKKQSANIAIRAMGRLGTTYALSVLDEITRRHSKYSESLLANAGHALRYAAQKKGISREELEEELMPDFGVTKEGLVLDTGLRKLCVAMDAGMNFVVRHDTGKTTKSFPKRKKDEPEESYNAAKSKFSILKKSLKPVLKQQLQRMEINFITASEYTAERWRKIYLHHPLLSNLVQGVIWLCLPHSGSGPFTFRISEDHSLIDSQDNPVDFSTKDRIRFWHPSDSREEERQEWKTHLADYELTDMLQQLEYGVYHLDDEEEAGSTFTRFKGRELKNVFRSRMKKLGFNPSIGDGGWICDHYKRLGSSGITVQINHSDMHIVYEEGESVTLETVELFINRTTREKFGLPEVGDIPIKDLPAVLTCSIIHMMEKQVIMN